MTKTKKSPKKSTRAKSSSSRSRAVVTSRRRMRAAPPAAPRVEPTFEGKQRLFDGEKPREREAVQPGDEGVTVQTLRVTRREVRRWNAAAAKSKAASGRTWETLHAMTWARKVLNRAADELLGSAL